MSPRRVVRSVCFGGLLVLACGAGTEPVPPTRLVENLSWLAGCWESNGEFRQLDEQWMRPRGGTMLGMGRTVSGDSTTDYEQMRIWERDGRLIFTAHPYSQLEASFTATEITPSRVVFENLQHDFPQRVIYQRAGDDSLVARIEGARGGTTRGIDFPMRRTQCAGDGGR